MLLSAYARAMTCPVLTSRMVLPGLDYDGFHVPPPTLCVREAIPFCIAKANAITWVSGTACTETAHDCL
eukprot:1602825-Rhodomonas_salina.4